jgi:hypothetical protein
LPDIVLSVSVTTDSRLTTPPPALPAELPDIVLSVSVTTLVPTFAKVAIPPPEPPAELPETVLRIPCTVLTPLNIAKAAIPPPEPPAVLSETVLLINPTVLVSLRAAKVYTPPPASLAELPDTMLFFRVSVPRLKIPPPVLAGVPPLATPPLIVVSSSFNLPRLLTARIRKLGVPLFRSIVLPWPWIVIRLVTTGKPVGP